MRVKLAIPALGPGEMITLADEPVKDTSGKTWEFDEMEVFTKALGESERQDVDMWIRYIDAVKRLYPEARLKSVEPLQIPPLTLEQLIRFPWTLLRR